MTTITKLGKEWRISFYFEPSEYGSAPQGDTATNATNLLHLTLRHGDRILAINLQPNRGMIVVASIGNEPNYEADFKDDLPPLNKETKIEVSQLRIEGKYLYRILVDEKELHSVENPNPQEFRNVSVYVSNPWIPSTPGLVYDLRMETNNGGTSTF